MLDISCPGKITIFCILVVWPCIASAALSQSYTERFNRLKGVENLTFRHDMTESLRSRKVLSAYAELFPDRQRGSPDLSTDERRSAFKAAELASFYGQAPTYIRQMESELIVLEKSGGAKNTDYVAMQGIYIMMRMMSEAVNLARTHPVAGMQSVLPIRNLQAIKSGKPGKLTIADDMRSLHYAAVELAGKQIVVVAQPACHFSQDAIRDIETRQSDLRPLFSKALWLAPPGTSLDISLISRWNSEHPEAALALTYRQRDWSAFDDWSTPTFYFLQNGKIVDKVKGWPPQGGYVELDKAIEKWKHAH